MITHMGKETINVYRLTCFKVKLKRFNLIVFIKQDVPHRIGKSN